MRALIIVVAFLLSPAVFAQSAYKCKDKAGKVTYAGTECHLLGLQPVGEVADRMNTAPAYKAPPSAAKPAESQGRSVWTPPPNPNAAIGSKPAAKADDKSEPARRCFTVQTKTGPVTRCNEKPDESAPPAPDSAQGREVRAQ